jgi:polyferredoxin
VVRDRNPDFVRLADGAIRNGYTLKLMNRTIRPQTFWLGVTGIKAKHIRVIGDGEITKPVAMRVDADRVRTVRVLVTVGELELASSHGLTFVLSDQARGESRAVKAVFVPGAAQ